MNHFTRAGNRKQFLIADSKTIYAFVTKGKKFPTCSTFSDKTCDIQCKVTLTTRKKIISDSRFKEVANLNTISLGSSRKIVPSGRVYTGNDCEWIDLNKVSSELKEVLLFHYLLSFRSAAIQVVVMETSLSSRTLEESTEDNFCLLKGKQSLLLCPRVRSSLSALHSLK